MFDGRNVLKIVIVLAAVAVPWTTAMAQIVEKPIAFEVVSIKPAPPLDMGPIVKDPASALSTIMSMGMKVDREFVSAESVTPAALIMQAYGVKRADLMAPDWAATERFSFRAKLPDGVSPDRLPEMLQAMLLEHFHIQVHEEHRESDGYVLRTNGSRLKLKPAGLAPDAAEMPIDISGMSLKQDGKGNTSVTVPGLGTTHGSPIEGNPMLGTHMDMPRITMKALASSVSRYVGHPVLDETGLDGSYAVSLDVSMADMVRAGGRSLPPSLDDRGGPDVLSSLRNQGLLLAPRKVPVTVLVVDHLDTVPTGN